MAIPQDIQNFYTRARTADFARNNLLRITAISPGTGGAGVNFTPNDLVYLTTANMPARTINNVPVPFMGLSFNVPGTVSFPGSNAWNVTFRCSADFNIRSILDRWSTNTFDQMTTNGRYQLGDTGTLDLMAYDTTGAEAYGLRLEGVYCVTVGAMAFNTTDAGAVVTVEATLGYQYWTKTS